MRKIVETTFMTLDGVISEPEVWGPPYWDDEHQKYAAMLLADADSLLLGRKTYEDFARMMPSVSNEYADRMNAMPKHVASRTLTDATWNATVLGDDVVGDLRRIVDQPGGTILKLGTGELDRTLLTNGLVDELHLWIFPVFAGRGDRILDGIDITHLALDRSTRFTSGIVVNVYRPGPAAGKD